MRPFALVLALSIALAAPSALAQDHDHMDHGAMDHGAMEHTPAQGDPAQGNSHAGHGPPAQNGISAGIAPAPPTDHAAEAFYNPADMAHARAVMRRESGGMSFSQLMLDRLEYRMGKGADGYNWEGEGWIGGDINRLAIKSEGEGEAGGPLERAEVQALYNRAFDPWFNLVAGLRHDVRPRPARTYAAIGIEGLAPYWFEVEVQAFLSTKGDAHLRLEGSYDQRITQRLILQPAAEVNVAVQDVPELSIGSGLSDIELGLRLRYEFAREFAPYLGVNWERKLGDTARFARQQGEGASATSLVAGIRFWF